MPMDPTTYLLTTDHNGIRWHIGVWTRKSTRGGFERGIDVTREPLHPGMSSTRMPIPEPIMQWMLGSLPALAAALNALPEAQEQRPQGTWRRELVIRGRGRKKKAGSDKTSAP